MQGDSIVNACHLNGLKSNCTNSERSPSCGPIIQGWILLAASLCSPHSKGWKMLWGWELAEVERSICSSWNSWPPNRSFNAQTRCHNSPLCPWAAMISTTGINVTEIWTCLNTCSSTNTNKLLRNYENVQCKTWYRSRLSDRLRAGWWEFESRYGNKLFSTPCRPDVLWGLPRLLFNGYGGPFPRR